MLCDFRSAPQRLFPQIHNTCERKMERNYLLTARQLVLKSSLRMEQDDVS